VNRVFLDTNIVADIIDKSRTNHNLAMESLERLIDNESTICISEDMITTLFYISKEKKWTLEFFKNVVFIDWEILNFSKNILIEAVEIALGGEFDLEDILQSLCAKYNECEVIITNDKKFYNCNIDVVNVHEYLSKF